MKRLVLLGWLFIAGANATQYDYVADKRTGYARDGRPLGMTNINAVLPNGILDDIYELLPEGATVNPDFIASDALSNIKFDDALASHATASVTFLNEAAGYRNSLGYFIYDPDNPPMTPDEVASHTIIFPNASKPGAGSLRQGDTVDLDIELQAGQALGFFVVPNGWGYRGRGSKIKSDGPWGQPFYSLSHLNPEWHGLNRHNVVFIDPANELLVIGFDDQLISYGDMDYNDVLFTVKISPFYAIDGVNEDGSAESDYVHFEREEGSTESTITSYYPSQNGYATMMFEDLWPVMGDYDFNDLVVRYRLKRSLNSDSGLKRLEGSYQVQAQGASFHNGLALRLPGVSASAVESVSLRRNGVAVSHEVIESAANELVLILSEDISVDLGSSCAMFRTLTSCREAMGLTFDLDVTFRDAPLPSTIGQPPYDPFIFAVNGFYHGDIFSSPPGRQWELHLKQFAGTNLFNTGLWGLGDDSSGVAGNYVNANKMPWAINIADEWSHTAEHQDISHAYPDFVKWVASDGFDHTDWYKRSNADTDKLYE